MASQGANVAARVARRCDPVPHALLMSNVRSVVSRRGVFRESVASRIDSSCLWTPRSLFADSPSGSGLSQTCPSYRDMSRSPLCNSSRVGARGLAGVVWGSVDAWAIRAGSPSLAPARSLRMPPARGRNFGRRGARRPAAAICTMSGPCVPLQAAPLVADVALPPHA
jgi:hypothetical protein